MRVSFTTPRLWVALMGLAALTFTAPLRPVAAQPGTGQPASGQPARIVDQPDYVIVVDDVIEVGVLGQPDYNRSLSVNTDGFVDYPLLGFYKAAGKKLRDLKTDITKALKKRFVNPQVTVAVRARPNKYITVFGAVGNRGKVIYKEGWRVLDAIAAAGGLSPVTGVTSGANRYELYTITLQKAKTGQTITIDPVKLFSGDESQNHPLDEDDVLNIYEKPLADIQVQVVGQVKVPNAVPLPGSGSIRDVLQLVGNATDIAALSRSFLRRKVRGADGVEREELIDVDLRGYQKAGFEPRLDTKATGPRKLYKEGGDGEPLRLQGGDVLVVPENMSRLYLFGKFSRAGSIPYPDDRTLTLFDAIAEYGADVNGAELKKTRITRKPMEPSEGASLVQGGWTAAPGPDGTTVYTKVVNVEKMLKTGDRAENFPLRPGDEIWVQATGPRRGLGINEIAAGAGALFTLFLLWNNLF